MCKLEPASIIHH